MIPPVVKERRVAADREVAFRRFTAGMGEWWPLETHTVFPEEESSIRMEPGHDGRIVERSAGGETAEWARVLEWAAPHAFALVWYPGRDPVEGQHLDVRFETDGAGLRIRIAHLGWEALGPAAEAVREGYDAGWDLVLDRYLSSFE